jgi:hypothetical protein
MTLHVSQFQKYSTSLKPELLQCAAMRSIKSSSDSTDRKMLSDYTRQEVGTAAAAAPAPAPAAPAAAAAAPAPAAP